MSAEAKAEAREVWIPISAIAAHVGRQKRTPEADAVLRRATRLAATSEGGRSSRLMGLAGGC